MKVLLDACVAKTVKLTLAASGYDVTWVGEWSFDPGDDAILDQARHEGRILVTLDKGFGERAIVHEQPHCGILRLSNLNSTQQSAVCISVLQKYGRELFAGAIVTAELGRLRIRRSDRHSA